jgi:hypothetical protein
VLDRTIAELLAIVTGRKTVFLGFALEAVERNSSAK